MEKRNYIKWVRVLCLIPLLLAQIISIKDVIAATMNPEETSLWISPAYQEITGNSVTLQWNSLSGAESYDLYQSTDTSFYKKIATVTASSYTVSSLSQSKRYHFEIIVNNSDGTKKLSNARTVYVKDDTNPNPVTGISSTKGDNWVRLTWTASGSSDVHHYEIWRNGVKAGIVNGDSTSYTDVGLTSGNYGYHLISVDSANNKSENSATHDVTVVTPSRTVVKLDTTPNGGTAWTNWTKTSSNSTQGYLTFPDMAEWKRSGTSSFTAAQFNVNANSPSFTVSATEDGKQAQITFTWSKQLSNGSLNDDGGTGYTRLYLYTSNNLSTSIWSELTRDIASDSNPLTGSASVNVTLPQGTYYVRFNAQGSSTTTGNDTVTITVDDVKVEYPAPTDPVPAAPIFTNVSLLNNDNSKANLRWTAPADTDIAGYQIYRSSTNDPSFSLIATTTNTSFIDPSIEHTTDPELQYSYKIVAVDNVGGTSDESNILDVTVPDKDSVQPTAPIGLRAASVSASKIDLSWTGSSSDDIANYIVWRSEDGINYDTSYITASTSLRVDSNVSEHTTYYFRVMAVDTSGNYSEGSNILWETTPEIDLIPPGQPVLNTPSDDDIGETYVDLSWEAVTDNVKVDRYSVQVKEGESVIKTVYVLNPLATGTIWQTVPSLQQNTAYTFSVTAFDSSGNASTPSNLINVITDKDTTAPKILFRKPAVNATNFPYGQPIIIRFDEALAPATVTNSSVKVAQVSGSEVTGTVKLSDFEIEFETDNLQPNTSYEVTLQPTITNMSGTPIGQQIVYVFTTGTEKFERPHGNYMDNTALCKYCHNTHTGERPRLLNKNEIYKVCFTCHDGTGAEGDGSTFNAGQQFGSSHATAKTSHHPVFPEDQPTATEGVTNFSCVSCHNPHDSGKNLDTGANNPSWKRLLDSFNKGDLNTIQPTRDNQGKEFCWNCHGNTGSDGGTGQNGYSHGYLDDTDKNGNSILTRTTVTGITFTETRYRTDHQTFFPKDNPTTPPIGGAKSMYGYGHNSWRMETYKKDFKPNGSTITGTNVSDKDGSSESGTNVTCVACHEKHGSNVKPLLRNDINGNDPNTNSIKNGKEFCYQCHQNAVEFGYSEWATETRHNNFDGKGVNEANGHAQFDCQVCHNPHGSPYPNYLRLNFRVDLSTRRSFQDSDAALCFDCHDRGLLLSRGAALRGRDDRGNYHNFHLNSQQASCKNCHRPHGAIATEQSTATKVNHKIGFPSSQVSGSRRYNRDASADDSLPGGSGSCSLNCHGRDHSSYNYDGAYRDERSTTNPYMLKTNWKTESWLLNNRPTIYQNGANGTHFRDGDFAGNPTQTAPNDGFHWK